MAKIHADPVLSLENVAPAYVKFRGGVTTSHPPGIKKNHGGYERILEYNWVVNFSSPKKTQPKKKHHTSPGVSFCASHDLDIFQ